eukprot:TRINITY_DN61353_c0_g1_i1.p1 TRINITY_DN61353_c0_g1~~TRINITY_DN61353_c0_g1_i1.p1  ORF type:complete len:553 (-),score=112.62 TRINITY_DN61353_c0_g1_i1:249-1907(-)
MLRSLVGSEMCIRDSINAEYGKLGGVMEPTARDAVAKIRSSVMETMETLHRVPVHSRHIMGSIVFMRQREQISHEIGNLRELLGVYQGLGDKVGDEKEMVRLKRGMRDCVEAMGKQASIDNSLANCLAIGRRRVAGFGIEQPTAAKKQRRLNGMTILSELQQVASDLSLDTHANRASHQGGAAVSIFAKTFVIDLNCSPTQPDRVSVKIIRVFDQKGVQELFEVSADSVSSFRTELSRLAATDKALTACTGEEGGASFFEALLGMERQVHQLCHSSKAGEHLTAKQHMGSLEISYWRTCKAILSPIAIQPQSTAGSTSVDSTLGRLGFVLTLEPPVAMEGSVARRLLPRGSSKLPIPPQVLARSINRSSDGAPGLIKVLLPECGEAGQADFSQPSNRSQRWYWGSQSVHCHAEPGFHCQNVYFSSVEQLGEILLELQQRTVFNQLLMSCLTLPPPDTSPSARAEPSTLSLGTYELGVAPDSLQVSTVHPDSQNMMGFHIHVAPGGSLSVTTRMLPGDPPFCQDRALAEHLTDNLDVPSMIDLALGKKHLNHC